MSEAVNRVTEVVSGGENLPVATLEQLGAATAALEQATADMKAAEGDRKEQFAKARDDAARDVQAIKERIDAQNEAIEAERQGEIDKLIAAAKNTREPSKAWAFSGNPSGSNLSYQAGDFIWNLYARKSNDFSIEERSKADKALAEMGATYAKATGLSIGAASAEGGFYAPDVVDERAKATLGLTGATGGVLIPGATVGDLVKPPRALTAVEGLVSTLRVDAYQSSIPVRVTTPTRAAVVAWGETKTNTNLTYGGYTATAYTLAIIYDIAKQFLRYSRGAAEADVRSELETAFQIGRAYYILQGSGSSEPYGIQTAIGNAFGAFTSSFSPSATTLAGSVAKAIATAAGGLTVRNWAPEAVLLGVAAYWDMVSQGTDTAGFFFAPAGGPTQIRPGTLVSPFGVPVYAETQLAATDDLLIGQFSAVQLFRSSDYRVDTSDEAGDRWDKNLVGFRGEEEIGLDARAAVFAGAFQFIADIVP